MTELTRTDGGALQRFELLRDARPGAAEVLTAFYRRLRKASTAASYRKDLLVFATDAGLRLPADVDVDLRTLRGAARDEMRERKHAAQDALVETAIGELIALDHPAAHRVLDGWRDTMHENGIGAATINRRLASLVTLSQAAHRIGATSWTLDAERMPEEPPQVEGPSLERCKAILAKLDQDDSVMGIRDATIVRTLLATGLRRAELCSLSIADLDAARSRLLVVGKGRTKGEWQPVGKSCANAWRRWLAVHPRRDDRTAPAFVSLGLTRSGEALSPNTIAVITHKAGGIAPHQLRHSAATIALDSGADMRGTSHFMRHKSVATTIGTYDDADARQARRVADLLDGAIG